MKLEELKMMAGCIAALAIDNAGICLACEHSEGQHTPAFDTVAKALSDVTLSMEKLAIELELATGRSCLPLEGWALMGQKLSVVMGNGGFRGIVLEEESGSGERSLKEYLTEIENEEKLAPRFRESNA